MSKVTIKGAPASKSQIEILRRALAYANKVGAPYKAKVALMEALAIESEAKNLSTPSADGYGSYGVLQGLSRYHSKRDLMNPEYQFGVFLGHGPGARKYPKGFTGKGNAIQLARTGMRSGDIAQAVEGSAYPDRYGQVAKEAMRNIRLLGGGAGGGGRTAAVSTPSGGASLPVTTGGPDIVGGILAKRRQGGLLDRLGLLDESSAPQIQSPTAPARATSPRPRRSGGGGGSMGPRSDLKELFWQGPGGLNIKNGQRVPQGFVSGHAGHVHVATGPKRVVELGKLAQRMGLHVGEQDQFGGRPTGGHAPGSYHYRGMGIDVSGDPAKMAEYARRVAARFR